MRKETGARHYMNAVLILAAALVLLCSSAVFAGNQERLVSLLVDYADLKQRVLEIREARKSGYSSDSRELMELYTEISAAKQETFQFRSDHHTAGTMDKTDETTSNMIYAYEAMSQIIAAEVDRNLSLSSSDTSRRLSEKYEDIWKMLDPSIPVVSAPS